MWRLPAFTSCGVRCLAAPRQAALLKLRPAVCAASSPVWWPRTRGVPQLHALRMSATESMVEEKREVTPSHTGRPDGEKWQVRLLYDGDCPLCMREVNFLLRKDGGRGIIDFVDISELDYDPQENGGISYEEAMGRIHGLLPNGGVVTNLEVFRRVYDALGMGWVYAVTKLPVVGSVANKELADLVREREEQLKALSMSDCEETCNVEW